MDTAVTNTVALLSSSLQACSCTCNTAQAQCAADACLVCPALPCVVPFLWCAARCVPRCAAPQVFVPTKDSGDISSLLKYNWFKTGWLAVQSLLGWPMYLLFNASGREYSRFTCHFDPFSPIFSRRERPGVSRWTDGSPGG